MNNLFQLGNDKVVIVRIVRKDAFRAAFDILRLADVFKSTAAAIVEQIKRAITKKAIERLRRDMIVTRKPFAFRISKKFVTVFHDRRLFSASHGMI